MKSVTECPPVFPLTQQQPGPVDRETGELQLLGRLLNLDSVFVITNKNVTAAAAHLALGARVEEPGARVAPLAGEQVQLPGARLLQQPRS